MLMSDWSNHALLFVAYVYGFILASSPCLGEMIDMQWPRALVFGFVGTGLLMAGTWRGVLPARLPPPYSLQYLAFWTLYGVSAWAWMVAVLGAARRWLNRDRPSLGYARRVGYWLYIVHQPVIVAIGFVVVQWRAPVAAKFVVILVASAVATLVCAELVRLPGAMRAAFRLSRAGRVGSEMAR
jgi:hypothetical protein